jgi:hypothetical protein
MPVDRSRRKVERSGHCLANEIYLELQLSHIYSALRLS